jgi:TolB-like protein/tetratricopeptide (TPR) repeat protein/tRNA A-37 threonylcarbamoyl transferase component Bud32
MMMLVDRLNAALEGRYRIEREIGRGGMASVFLAEDLKHERRVAIKLLRPELANAVGPERFLREIKVTAKLSHPAILPLHDSGEAGGYLFYVMPYIDGESLRQRLQRDKKLSRADALRIAGDVADALDHAHVRGVVHRDIKPENILLQDGRAVVADFGVALALKATEPDRLTEAGLAIGTLAYMSPEQLQGQPVDGRADQYALACVLWEMLGGTQPFEGPTAEAILTQKLLSRTRGLRTHGDAMSRDVERAVERALSGTPSDRFASSGDFIAAMAQTAPVPLRHRVVERVRSWPVSVVVGSAAMFGLLGGAGWFAWPFVTEPRADDHRYVRSVAVMYFENADTSHGHATALGEAVTEDVIARLARIRQLRVVPPLSVSRYRRAPKPAVDVAKELGVDAVLQGSVTTAGERLHLSLQLVDGEHGYVMWTHTADGTAREVFAIQDTLASTVARILALELSRAERRAIHRAPTRDFAAYQLYLDGMARLTRWNAGGTDSAIKLLRSAIERDSSFIDAHAQLAFAYLVQAYFGYADRGDVLDKVKFHSAKALAADPRNDVALLGNVAPTLLRMRRGERPSIWELRQMIVASKQLYEQDPDSPVGNIGMAHFYLWLKHDTTTAKLLFRRVLSSADVAIQIDSTNQFVRGMAAQASGVLATVVARENNLKGAIELSELSLKYVPGVSRTLSQLARYYDRSGQPERALETLQRAVEAGEKAGASGARGGERVSLGAQYYRMGKLREAEQSFARGVKFLSIDDPLRDYALLYWRGLAERGGDAREPARLMRERLAIESDKKWLNDLLAFSDGRIDEEELVGKTKRSTERCEAFYVMGARALAQGRRADAKRYFESAIATRATGYLEYDFASAELKLLHATR